MELTPTARLVDHLVPGGLENFVRARRAEGRSWRGITFDLYGVSKGKVELSHEILRRWFGEAA